MREKKRKIIHPLRSGRRKEVPLGEEKEETTQRRRRKEEGD